MMAIAAALSTSITGFLFQQIGSWAGFFTIAGVAAAATVSTWPLLSETKPEQY
jgi:hypothetical protein